MRESYMMIRNYTQYFDMLCHFPECSGSIPSELDATVRQTAGLPVPYLKMLMLKAYNIKTWNHVPN